MQKTLSFISKKFSEYYAKTDIEMPPRFGRREWGFFLWSRDGMVRHTSFNSKGEVRKFLYDNSPKHVYFSSAYYERPNAPTMGGKGWLGADLIFDIDADHVVEDPKMPYKDQLARVKLEINKLVFEFLLGDLGFKSKDLLVVFSGGRGYHVHVHDPRVLDLNSHERREIVDYIMALDLDTEKLLIKKTAAISGRGEFAKAQIAYNLPTAKDPGWKGRFRRSLDKLLGDLEEMDRPVALKKLKAEKGIGDKMAEKIYDALFKEVGGHRGVDKIRDRHTLEIFDSDKMRNALTKLALHMVKVEAGEADAPVTKDVNRLIRLPGSIHGKTALGVIRLDIPDIDDFEPLRDAVVFGKQEIEIELAKDEVVDMNDEVFDLKQGKAKVPECVAMLLMCSGRAKLV
jgi:DNA primase small subunit